MKAEKTQAEMTEGKKKVFSKSFKRGLAFTVGILAASICIALAYIWVSLDNYEKSSADNVANRIFNNYFFNLDAEKLFALGLPSLCEFETLDNFRTRIFEIAGNKERSIFAVYSGSGYTDAENSKNFVVLSGDEVFAEFAAVQKKGSRRTVWEMSQLSVSLGVLESYEIIVTAGSEVFVNGKLLEESYKTQRLAAGSFAGELDKYSISGFIAEPAVEIKNGRIANTLFFDCETKTYSDLRIVTADILEGSSFFINGIPVTDEFLFADGISAPQADRLNLSYNRYKVLAANELEMRVINKNGQEGLLKEGSNSCFIQEIAYSSELQNEYETFAKEAAMTYAKYMTNDTTLADVGRFFETGTVIYEAMRLAEVYWYIVHIGYWFENVHALEFYDHGDGVFSFRVMFDHYIERREDIQMFKLDSTFFARQTGGRYLVFDMIPNV